VVRLTSRSLAERSGSDMHVLLTGDLGLSKFNKPFVLGHECAGIVAKGESYTSC
jgi:D-arabinose 1-dehydrogenase-like Zn-dependent alcohol dehydrogenase